MLWRQSLRSRIHSFERPYTQILGQPARRNNSSSAQTTRASRDIASLLDSPLNKDPSARQVRVLAHVRSVRAQKQRAFVNIGDGSTNRSVQAILDPSLVAGLGTGTAVEVTGSWQRSPPSKEQTHELHASQVDILGPTDPQSYPVQKKHLTAEFLRTIPHLRIRTTSNALLARLRSECEYHISTHFRNHGFVRLHPPVITSSDCEGAGEVFTVRPRDKQASASDRADLGHAQPLEPKEGEFFKSPKYLTVSNQLHLEAFVHEHPRVWALAPTFRAEKSDTPRHLSEFYMLEAETRCRSLDEIMDVAEQLIKSIARNVQESPLGREMIDASRREASQDEGTSKDRAELLLNRFRALKQPYWPRISYTEAIQLLRRAAREEPESFTFLPDWNSGLQVEHEKYIASVVGGGCPVFVTDYPKHQKPFYMLPSHLPPAASSTTTTHGEPAHAQRWTSHSLPQSPSVDDHMQEAHPTVACFDLLLPDIGELVGGSLREHRFDALEASMRTQELSGLDWYLDLRKYGSVPHGGFGLGFDRLLMYLSGADSVRDVVQWPRYYGKCDA